MADHLDAPGLTSPAMDTRVDITDLYAFQKPSDASRSILILNVNPLAPTHANEFRSDAAYEILVDTNGDAAPEIVFLCTFSAKDSTGAQTATVVRSDLAHVGPTADPSISLVVGAPVSFTEVHITRGHEDTQFFAGFRSDPFFFDLMGFLNGLKFTGSDFFADKNVFGIALDIPNRLLGSNPKVGIWARTRIPATLQPDRLVQVDQMGRPGINTVFNHGNDKNVFNVTQPANMRNAVSTDSATAGMSFLAVFQAELQALSAGSPKGAYSADQAMAIAQILLPDILTYDYSSSAGYLNGRQLQDDVIDISLNLVTNGALTGDGVGPHHDYTVDFPYLGGPHV